MLGGLNDRKDKIVKTIWIFSRYVHIDEKKKQCATAISNQRVSFLSVFFI